jgi:nitroimidazol reductase NimA-like FMN-containing flavoprotein (pyridoxamine 5'-phosphate oxidase superfamily)
MTGQASLDELTTQECYELLATVLVGRLAVAGDDGCPTVVPVNFVLDGESVVFRTDAGMKLHALRSGRASFQADHVDPHAGTGWSVLVRGAVHTATAWEVARLDLEPWAPGAKGTWFRLTPRFVTGRRLSAAGAELDGRGYL